MTSGKEQQQSTEHFSGIAQLALLFSLLPFVLSFSLFALVQKVPTPEYFPILESASVETAKKASEDLSLFLLIALFIFYPFAIIRCIWKRHWGWLLLGLLVPHAMILVMATGGWGETLIPFIAAKVAFLWFAARGRFASFSFVVFALTLFIVSGVGADTAWEMLLPITVFILAALLFRMVFAAAGHNRYFIRHLGFLRSSWLTMKTLVLWMPILLFAAPYFIGTYLLHHEIENQIYTIYIEEYDDRGNLISRKPFMEQYTKDNVRNIEVDARLTVGWKFMLTWSSWYNTIEYMKRQAAETRKYPFDQISDKFGEEFDKVVEKELPFDAPNFTGFMSGAKNWSVEQSQSEINKAYQYLRSKTRENLMARVDEIEGDIKEKVIKGSLTAEEGLESFRATLRPIVIEANKDTQLTMWWTFAYMHAAHALAQLLFAFICLRSFMYVFSRVAFAKGQGFVTLGQTEGTPEMPLGTVRVSGDTYTIPQEEEGVYYFARKFQPQGKPPSYSLPQPLKCPITRFFHNMIAMNKIAKKTGEHEVSFTLTRGESFIEWDMKEGETVVFGFKNFVGMSETVTLATLISARIPAILLGHLIFSTATGPGKLILTTKGRPKVAEFEDSSPSLPPDRLVAWQLDTRFHVESELNLIDLYMSSAYVNKEGPGLVVVDVDRQTRIGNGLVSFLRNFILPH